MPEQQLLSESLYMDAYHWVQLTADKWVHGFQFVECIHEYWHTLGKLIDSVFYFLANVRLCNGRDSCCDDGHELLRVILYCISSVT